MRLANSNPAPTASSEGLQTLGPGATCSSLLGQSLAAGVFFNHN